MTNFNITRGRTDLIPIGTRVRVRSGQANIETSDLTGVVDDHWETGDGYPLGVIAYSGGDMAGQTVWVSNDVERLDIDPPTTATTLRSRADELTAKAEANREELRGLQERVNALDREAWSLNGLAAQYRAVADDLEAQK